MSEANVKMLFKGEEYSCRYFTCKGGATVMVTEEKAKQLLTDFPMKWEIVTGDLAPATVTTPSVEAKPERPSGERRFLRYVGDAPKSVEGSVVKSGEVREFKAEVAADLLAKEPMSWAKVRSK